MNLKLAVESIEFKNFSTKEFLHSYSTTAPSQIIFVGKTLFSPSWKAGEMLITLSLKGNVGETQLLTCVFEAKFEKIDYDSFTTEGEITPNKLLFQVLAGLTFSTARGVIVERIPTLPLVLPITPPDDLISEEGFGFVLNVSEDNPKEH